MNDLPYSQQPPTSHDTPARDTGVIIIITVIIITVIIIIIIIIIKRLWPLHVAQKHKPPYYTTQEDRLTDQR